MDIGDIGFDTKDPLKLQLGLTKEEKSLEKKIIEFATSELLPTVNQAFWDEESFLLNIKKLGKLKIFGGEIAKSYGGEAITPVSYGLIAKALERIDSGYRTAYSVMGSLVMHTIDRFGSDAQKKHYLPTLLTADLIAAFALTEPEAGSDTAKLTTTIKEVPGGICLSGKKRWIGLGHYADILIVWAKDQSNTLRGVIVPRDLKGVETNNITGKLALRVIPQADIEFHDVFLKKEALLPKASSFKAPFSALNHARYGISWGALGAAERCLDIALNYTKSREAFGSKLAKKQLVQAKLVSMQVEIALGLQGCFQVAKLIEKGQATHQMISLLKLNSAKKALKIAEDARDLLGGNGILDQYEIIRHLNNLHAVNTYEGTETIHTLILGKALTGEDAF